MHIDHHYPHDGCASCKRAEQVTVIRQYVKQNLEELMDLAEMFKEMRANGILRQWVEGFIKTHPDNWAFALEMMQVFEEVRNSQDGS